MGRSAERLQQAEARLEDLTSQGLREEKAGVKVQTEISKLSKEVKSRKRSYMTTLRNNPSARFHPALADMVRQGAMDHATVAYHGLELDAALKTISESHTWQEMSVAIGKENFSRIYNDVTRSWMKLA